MSPERVEIVDSIAAVDRDEWNRLATPAGFYSSYEWLATVEPENQGHCRYVEVWQGDRLAAALPVYLVTAQSNTSYRPATHFDKAPAAATVCLAGSHRGYRNTVLLDPELTGSARAGALAAVADALGRTCAGAGYAYFLFLTSAGVATLRELGGCLPPVPTYAAEATLAAVGEGFDDYLGSLTATRRKTVRKEIRRFGRAGLTVSVEPVWEQRDLLVRLVGNLNRKHGRAFAERDHRAALDRQQEHLAGSAVMFVCRAGLLPVGLTMGFVWGGWLYLWYAGFDYDRMPGGYEYFNVTIYEPLRYCYEHGLSGVHLGAGTQHAKGVRGATVAPLFASAWPVSEVDELASTGLRERVAEHWRAQISLAPRAFPVERWGDIVPGRQKEAV
ncbi:GNAT family N-acetyltransferase [Actinophytocola sp.]|uniref:GNAT family N-acetyltransferase n=1 Tax=Actinophytocola sp. TaxID=1872138 RepID=UPI00389A9BAA